MKADANCYRQAHLLSLFHSLAYIKLFSVDLLLAHKAELFTGSAVLHQTVFCFLHILQPRMGLSCLKGPGLRQKSKTHRRPPQIPG